MLDRLDSRDVHSRDPDVYDRRDHDRERATQDREHDPRDVFLEGLEMPRGHERELVLDHDRVYELDGDESRSLAAVGAFRVIPEQDLFDSRDDSPDRGEGALEHLREQGLVRTVSLNGDERAVTLTKAGRDLLEANCHDRDDDRHQEFYAGVSKPRELIHDASLYRAYLDAEARLRNQGATITRVVLEQEFKSEYQSFLQAHNRDRPDSDGRPDRTPRERKEWADEHELPYFDERVHFPDFRIEYEIDGLERHEDIEILTPHYRGAHAAGRGRAGFTCYGGRRGSRARDSHFAEQFL
jgi:hypothetical protein